MIRTNKVQFDCLKFIEHWQTVQEISRATERDEAQKTHCGQDI